MSNDSVNRTLGRKNHRRVGAVEDAAVQTVDIFSKLPNTKFAGILIESSSRDNSRLACVTNSILQRNHLLNRLYEIVYLSLRIFR